jgi:hypothetical protein
MSKYSFGDVVAVVTGHVQTAEQLAMHAQAAVPVVVLREMPYSAVERGHVEYELSDGRLVPEHQLVLITRAPAPEPKGKK